MDGGAWWAAVHGVAKSWTRLSGFTFFRFQGPFTPPASSRGGESRAETAEGSRDFGTLDCPA